MVERKYGGFTITKELTPIKVYNNKLHDFENKQEVRWVGRSGNLFFGFYVQMGDITIKAPTLAHLKMAIKSFSIDLNTSNRYWWNNKVKWQYK